MVTFKFDLDGDNPEDIAIVMVKQPQDTIGFGFYGRGKSCSLQVSLMSSLVYKPSIEGHGDLQCTVRSVAVLASVFA